MMSVDDIYALINKIADMLRVLTLDPDVPQHAKRVVWKIIQTLEEALEELEDGLGA